MPNQTSRNPRVLSVLAHPDDECIFGWPIFQNPRLDKSLIMLVSDRDNPERRWCARRLEALEEVCREHRVRLSCLNLNSEFYRLPYRRADQVLGQVYEEVARRVASEMKEFQPDFVFCHNPHGEYGMFDHRLVFDMVYHHSTAEHVVITDLCETHPGWPSFDRIPPRAWRLYYQDRPSVAVRMDVASLKSCKAVYDRYGCWTWKKDLGMEDPPPLCRLYLLDSEVDPELEMTFQRLGNENEERASEREK